METMLFNQKAHKEFVERWLLSRDMSTSHADALPETGLITFYESTPVCAGFLRQVEGDFVMIDSMITNPDMHPAVRNEALDIVTSGLIQLARDFGMKKIMANSTDAHTLERAERFGFKRVPQVLIVLTL